MDARSSDRATCELGDLASELVNALSTDPDQVEVIARRNEDVVQVQVFADDEQYGRLVGRNGSTARSLRQILGAVAGKYKVRCDLNIGPFATTARVQP